MKAKHLIKNKLLIIVANYYIEINNLYTFKCVTNLVDGNEVNYTSSYVDKIYVCIATLLLKVKFRRI